MKILQMWEFRDLMEKYPDGGIVFTEYKPDVYTSELMVTDGDFGARAVMPHDGEVFDFDWDIGSYRGDNLFAVFDNNDVLQMIQTLVSGLKINLTTMNFIYI